MVATYLCVEIALHFFERGRLRGRVEMRVTCYHGPILEGTIRFWNVVSIYGNPAMSQLLPDQFSM
jgi:hypothetical protein